MGVFLEHWLSNLTALESVGELFEQITGLIGSDSGSLGWVPRICISSKFSSASDLLSQKLTALEYESSFRIARVK